MPSFTVQCGRNFSLAAFCASASFSGLNLARCGSSTSPCQLVTSLPLKRATNPGGGVLSFGPALSSAARAVVRANIEARPSIPNDFLISSSLQQFELESVAHVAGRRRQMQGENDSSDSSNSLHPAGTGLEIFRIIEKKT